MTGNKSNGDNIAQEFAKLLSSRQTAASLKKEAAQASDSQIKTALDEVNPEDFLVAPETETKDTKINSIIDNKISELSDACQACGKTDCDCPEEVCEACGQENCQCQQESCAMCGAEDHQENMCMMGMANDASDLMDTKAQYILKELGKMASNFRQQEQFFAADVVEATAISIRNDLVKEASQKLETILGLKKLASQTQEDGDLFACDLIHTTIKRIKQSKDS